MNWFTPQSDAAMRCARCGKPHPSDVFSNITFCIRCYAALTDEQRETYLDAVMKVWHAPAGKLGFFQRQLEMVVEDLTKAMASATAGSPATVGRPG